MDFCYILKKVYDFYKTSASDYNLRIQQHNEYQMSSKKIFFPSLLVMLVVYGVYLALGSKHAFTFTNGKSAAEHYTLVCLDIKNHSENTEECLRFYNEIAPNIFRGNEKQTFLTLANESNFKEIYNDLMRLISKNPAKNWVLKPYSEIVNQLPQ